LLVLGIELGTKYKIHWRYQYLNIVLELLTGAKKNSESWIRKQGNCGERHTKADVDCLFVPTNQGGRGQKQTTEAYVVGTTKLVEYVDSKKDPLTRIVRKHQHTVSSTMLPRAKRLNIELQREARQIKERTAENRKEIR
jgi:hypothetical protein